MTAYQGTFATIKQAVIDKLRLDATAGDNSPDDLRAGEWVNIAYLDAVQATGALETVGNATLTNGTASYLLPAAVAQINMVTITYTDGTVSEPLQRVPLETILQNRRATLAENCQRANGGGLGVPALLLVVLEDFDQLSRVARLTSAYP